MKRFIEGEDRKQVTLLPECLDDFVAEDNPVRIIEAFIEELDPGSLGFDGAMPSTTGRPSYHPSVLLKIYIGLPEPGSVEPSPVNTIGLERRNFSKDAIQAIREAYKVLYRSGETLDEAKPEIARIAAAHPEVQPFYDFLSRSARG